HGLSHATVGSRERDRPKPSLRDRDPPAFGRRPIARGPSVGPAQLADMTEQLSFRLGEPRPDILQELQPVQRLAVEHGTGPLLVVAGAGTGKTNVLTARIV